MGMNLYVESGIHSSAHANKGLSVAKSNVEVPKVTYFAGTPLMLRAPLNFGFLSPIIGAHGFISQKHAKQLQKKMRFVKA